MIFRFGCLVPKSSCNLSHIPLSIHITAYLPSCMYEPSTFGPISLELGIEDFHENLSKITNLLKSHHNIIYRQ